MITGVVLANTVLAKASKEGIDITPMKLQKLIYFICKEYVRQNDDLLFTEPFEVWKYGPVLPSVYGEFSSYHSAPIKTYAKDSQGVVFVIDETRGAPAVQAIRAVWDKYKDCPAAQLSKMTHQEHTAWSSAKASNRRTIDIDDIRKEIEHDRNGRNNTIS